MPLTKRQLDILQHSLGVDQYGEGRMSRNHFCAGADDEPTCRELVVLGFMRQHLTTSVFPYFNCTVTDAGKDAMRKESPRPPKLTRSQVRYRKFLREDTGMSFGEWLTANRSGAERNVRVIAVRNGGRIVQKMHIDQTAQAYGRTRRGAHHAVCPPQPSEAQIQQTCTDLLMLDGWRPLRTDPCSDKSRGKGFGEVGMADSLFIRYNCAGQVGLGFDPWPTDFYALAEVMWIEFKTPKGKPTKQQITWHQAERARGALTLIAGVDFPASIEGFWAWYGNSGLKRKDIKLP